MGGVCIQVDMDKMQIVVSEQSTDVLNKFAFLSFFFCKILKVNNVLEMVFVESVWGAFVKRTLSSRLNRQFQLYVLLWGRLPNMRPPALVVQI